MQEVRNVNGYVAPALTVDALLVEKGWVLLVQRKNDPHRGTWALPGGFVEVGERTDQAALRELQEETGLEGSVVGLHGVYSDPARDPRGHTVSIIYQVERMGGDLRAGDDAAAVKFWPLSDLPPLAFDHGRILEDFRRNRRGLHA
ncbi:MAG TPA: NUDIX hydrolase [Candidatus Thermoplasmatota archaeon]|nr:NUDIX hydrolase [Candidatus Thermoplasmatota archaeon]